MKQEYAVPVRSRALEGAKLGMNMSVNMWVTVLVIACLLTFHIQLFAVFIRPNSGLWTRHIFDFFFT